MAVTTDASRVASLVAEHGITELAEAIYEWLSVDLAKVTESEIVSAIRSYADVAL